MSLILDALNRSRQDADPVPGLATQHLGIDVPASPLRYLPWAALLVALGLIAWLLLERDDALVADAELEDLQTGVAQLSRNISSAANAVGGELQARVEQNRVQQQDMAVALPVEPEIPSPPGATAAPAAPVVLPVGAPAVAPDVVPEVQIRRSAAIAQLYEQQGRKEELVAEGVPGVAEPQLLSATMAEASREETVDIEQVLAQARDEMGNGGLMEHATPFLSAMSKQIKDGIPTLLYQRHEYTADSARASVALNGRTLQTGGSAPPGVKVEEILPGSVILSYRGTRFRLRALNSWVNL